VWEALHIPLFTDYGDLGEPLPITIYATLGDVLYTLLAFFGVAIYKRDFLWTERARGIDYAMLAVIGLSIAVFVELKGLLMERWVYTAEMPLILGLGVSPLLQMTILLPLSIFISNWVVSRVFDRL
jgi:hypothetical protein